MGSRRSSYGSATSSSLHSASLCEDFQGTSMAVEYNIPLNDYDEFINSLDPEEAEELDLVEDDYAMVPYLRPFPEVEPSIYPRDLQGSTINRQSWNEKFQRLITHPCLTQEALVKRNSELSICIKRFRSQVLEVVKTKVDEMGVPERKRSLRLNENQLGGVAGGAKFIHDGILYKCVDANMGKIYGSEYLAGKNYSHELNANRSILMSNIRGIHAPFSMTVTYKAIRFYALMEVPIHSNSLIYGSPDQGGIIRTKLIARYYMSELCNKLNLALHSVRGKKGLRTRMYGPLDIEGHFSKLDGRFYLLDVARLFPPLPPKLCYCHFRAEFLAKWPVALSSDTYSRFGVDTRHEDDAKEALGHLVNHVIPEAARELTQYPELDGTNIVRILHSHGVNLAFLGKVAEAINSLGDYDLVVKKIEQEMISRTFKYYLYKRIHKKFRNMSDKPNEPLTSPRPASPKAGYGSDQETSPRVAKVQIQQEFNDIDDEDEEKPVKQSSIIHSILSRVQSRSASMKQAHKGVEKVSVKCFEKLVSDPNFHGNMIKQVANSKYSYKIQMDHTQVDWDDILTRVSQLTGFHYDVKTQRLIIIAVTKHSLDYEQMNMLESKLPNTGEDYQNMIQNYLKELETQETMSGTGHIQLIPTLHSLVDIYLGMEIDLFKAESYAARAAEVAKMACQQSCILEPFLAILKQPKGSAHSATTVPLVSDMEGLHLECLVKWGDVLHKMKNTTKAAAVFGEAIQLANRLWTKKDPRLTKLSEKYESLRKSSPSTEFPRMQSETDNKPTKICNIQ